MSMLLTECYFFALVTIQISILIGKAHFQVTPKSDEKAQEYFTVTSAETQKNQVLVINTT